MSSERPIPVPDEDTSDYWEGVKQGELRLQRCRECGTVQTYPRKVCMNCMSRELKWFAASGRGKIYSYSVVYRAPPGFEDDVPYVVAIIELEEGVRLMTNIVEGVLEHVAVERPVEVVFCEVTNGVVLPQFRLVDVDAWPHMPLGRK